MVDEFWVGVGVGIIFCCIVVALFALAIILPQCEEEEGKDDI